MNAEREAQLRAELAKSQQALRTVSADYVRTSGELVRYRALLRSIEALCAEAEADKRIQRRDAVVHVVDIRGAVRDHL